MRKAVLATLVAVGMLVGVIQTAAPAEARAFWPCGDRTQQTYHGSAKDSYYGAHLTQTVDWCARYIDLYRKILTGVRFQPTLTVCCGWSPVGPPQTWRDDSHWPHYIVKRTTFIVEYNNGGFHDTGTIWIQQRVWPSGLYRQACSGYKDAVHNGCDGAPGTPAMPDIPQGG